MPYYSHFGLDRDPFLDTADPHFYRSTGNLAHAKNRLVQSIEQSRGLMIVVGDPGTGKTSLAGAIERELLNRDNVRLGKILDPSFAGAFPPRSPAALKNALKNFFYDAAVVEGSTVALFIDEAQNLSDENLETLRLLLNFDVPERKLLNIVLFGQSEFRDQVNKRRNLARHAAPAAHARARDARGSRPARTPARPQRRCGGRDPQPRHEARHGAHTRGRADGRRNRKNHAPLALASLPVSLT